MVSPIQRHELRQTPGGAEGQGSLVCCSPRGGKEQDTTWQLNNRYASCLMLLSYRGVELNSKPLDYKPPPDPSSQQTLTSLQDLGPGLSGLGTPFLKTELSTQQACHTCPPPHPTVHSPQSSPLFQFLLRLGLAGLPDRSRL